MQESAMIGFTLQSDIHRGDRLNPTMTGEKGYVHIAEVSLGIGGYRYHTTCTYMRTYRYMMYALSLIVAVILLCSRCTL